MAALARRARRSTNIWPGFVDALATLLLVLMFLVMVFVLAQFFLNEALSGRDAALQKLESHVSELADLLGLERAQGAELRLNIAQLSEELQASVTLRDDLNATIEALTLRAESAEQTTKRLNKALEEAFATIEADNTKLASQSSELAALSTRAESAEERAARLRKALEDAFATVEADKAKIQVQVRELAALTQSVAALRALKDELETKIAEMSGKLGESEAAVIAERDISESARARLALLNRQMAALREQLAQLSAVLEASEVLSKNQKVQIANLGKRLNAALATKVQELSRYRSEFFGRLREVLGRQPGVRIVGDRFVFQSEVLFASGSAELGKQGTEQLGRLADTLREISMKIPKDIDWILRIDGHTDKVPIHTAQFPSNWELSSARAISVVKFLKSREIPANRLVAAGFGEHQPLDDRDDEIGYRRNRRIELKLTQR
ncbi:MAG: peptidoglycan -binding protein [Alphaproteobacteria bacterium]|nr:peptidoglycan -binding protein [Alphaproteobacteria bacterium]